MAQLDSLMRQNFIDYASYSILDRAIPDIRDGLKPVQRRILHTLFEMHDGRYHKVANTIGESMKLHPHGDASIGNALVVLANKDYFIDKQGNYGSVLTGHPAAASRYIECRLTPLALATLFNADLTDFVDSYDGRSREPVFLPAKLPVLLMLGTEGIAVGMATRILPHNLVELWQAQIACLRDEPFALFPDFPQGGEMDASEYADGSGKVEIRANVEAAGEKRVVIREIPYGTTSESLIASIEAAVQKGRVKVASIDDFTTDKIEIELKLPRGVTSDEVIPQLHAYTDCSLSVSSNLVCIREGRPVQATVSEVLVGHTAQLREQIRAELELEQRGITDRKHWLTLEQIFVEKRVYKKIETAKTEKAVKSAVASGMKAHSALFIRPMVDDDIKRLLDLRIRRISLFDIEKNRGEIEECDLRLAEIDRLLGDLTGTTIDYLEGLVERFGAEYPRRTQHASFEAIEKKAVAQPTIKLMYDRESGFFGTAVKSGSREMMVSEFDLILAITNDGVYRIVTPPEKLLLSGKLLYLEVFDPELGLEFAVVYRDLQKNAFGKRVHVHKFIRNREYQLVKDKAGKVDLLLLNGETGTLMLDYVPAKRQRVRSGKFDLDKLEPMGVSARGVRLAPKPVAKLRLLPKKTPRAKPKPKPKAGNDSDGESSKPASGRGDGRQTSLF
jgi:topoisomerase-4 subunit A